MLQVLTSGHTRVFEKSLLSAIKYLVDLDIIYVLAPKAEKLKEDYKGNSNINQQDSIDASRKTNMLLGKFPVDKVVFVDESIFPINWINVSEVMIQSVADKGTFSYSFDIIVL